MPETESPSQVAFKTTPETARLARQLYTEGMPLADIARRTGLSIRTIYYWADRVVSGDGAVTLSPVPRRVEATKVAQRRKGTSGNRVRGRAGAKPGGTLAGARRGQAGKGGRADASFSGVNETGRTDVDGAAGHASDVAPTEGAAFGRCHDSLAMVRPDIGAGDAGGQVARANARPDPHAHRYDVGRDALSREGERCLDDRHEEITDIRSVLETSDAKPHAARHAPADALKGRGDTSRRRQQPARAHVASLPRHRLLARLWRTAERQVAEIESRMRAGADGDEQTMRTAAESEKDARALALIARTLRELTAAEDDAARATGMKPNDGSARDLDDFRRELARRLECLRTDGEDGAAVSVEPE